MAVIAVVAVLAGAVAAVVWMRSEDTEIQLAENQSYVYAYVTKIEGNEITYTEVEESVITAYQKRQDASEEEKTKQKEKAASEEEKAQSEEGASGSEQSGGESTDGERPERSGQLEGMEMPEGSGQPEGDASDAESSAGMGGMGSGKAVTTLIPVGVTVHTMSDTETTFQRLAAGDMIKLLVETDESKEEVITEIWML